MSSLIAVVSYRNSTSNHNFSSVSRRASYVVSYRNSTSNHNYAQKGVFGEQLYLIEILHQTTTVIPLLLSAHWLYLIEILHQTTTLTGKRGYKVRLYLIEILHQTTTLTPVKFLATCCILSKFYIKPQLLSLFYWRVSCCILSKFYIKPQQSARADGSTTVVSYRNSTSNHNLDSNVSSLIALYLIEILHQTTTVGPHID